MNPDTTSSCSFTRNVLTQTLLACWSERQSSQIAKLTVLEAISPIYCDFLRPWGAMTISCAIITSAGIKSESLSITVTGSDDGDKQEVSPLVTARQT